MNAEANAEALRRAHALVEGFDAFLWSRVEKRTAPTRIQCDVIISDISLRSAAISELKERLQDKFPPEMDITVDDNLPLELQHMLATVRVNEQGLDPVGLRLRRWAEYQKLLQPLRAQLAENQNALRGLINTLTDSLTRITVAESLARALHAEFVSYVNRRITHYWQGVMKNHPQSDTLPMQPPLLPEAEQVYHSAHVSVLEEKLRQAEAMRDLYESLDNN